MFGEVRPLSIDLKEMNVLDNLKLSLRYKNKSRSFIAKNTKLLHMQEIENDRNRTLN